VRAEQEFLLAIRTAERPAMRAAMRVAMAAVKRATPLVQTIRMVEVLAALGRRYGFRRSLARAREEALQRLQSSEDSVRVLSSRLRQELLS
jgi:hypothetical protein